MAYNKFKKLEELRVLYRIESFSKAWLPILESRGLDISEHLKLDLKEASAEALASEKAKSELIIIPVIKELKRQHPNTFSLYSGYQFTVSKELTGYCDFILSAEINKLEVTAPIFLMVEAKDGEIEKGLAQCAAEMYAAHLFNEKHGISRKVVFGCVTNAFSWCFLRLEGLELLIDPNYVPLTFTEPHRVLEQLGYILHQSLSED